jgi:SAM-dependent methyltransferase
LNELELNELGGVDGLSVLHLQCHLGLDSISLARMGASVTGIDFSEAALRKARDLARQLKVRVRFILSDIYDLKDRIQKKFDLVFTSYGVITWLPDLNTWAEMISGYLKPGGIFYLAEFHPILWMFDEPFKQIRYPYDSGGTSMEFSDVSSYAAPEIPLRNHEYNWQHGIGRVLNALISAGLRIEFLNEHFYSPYPVFPEAVEKSRSRWIHEKFRENIPYVFSIKAKKY